MITLAMMVLFIYLTIVIQVDYVHKDYPFYNWLTTLIMAHGSYSERSEVYTRARSGFVWLLCELL